MKRYQRVLLCIEHADRDGQMLDYTGAVCRLAESKELHFLHVAKARVLPEEPAQEGAGPAEVTAETLSALAAEFRKTHAGQEVICHVCQGAPLVEILRYAMDKDIDLIVMGRPRCAGPRPADGSLLLRRVTMKATCSVLVLPEGAKTKADAILVPVRDSECSANAVRCACEIAAVVDGTVCCLNVFPVGSGYSKIGSTLEQHITLLARHARHETERLLAGVDQAGARVIAECVPDLYAHPASLILREIEKRSADLVVIGARGRSGAAGVLLGKVTEGLIQESPVPVLAVKKKGECIGIVQALLILTG